MDHFSNLTPKQATFCDEFFKDFNATKAALRAGYSPATALNGHLMTLPKIKYHLQQRGAAAAEEAQVTHQMVLAELKKIAFANMGDFFDANGQMKPMQQVDAKSKAALLNYTVTEDKDGCTTIKIRMNNKLSALDKIAKHLKFYDAEHPAHDVKYWITDFASMDANDRYDDEAYEGGQMSEDGGQNQEARCKNQDEGGRMSEDGSQMADVEDHNDGNTDKYPSGENQDSGCKNQDVGTGIENTDKYPSAIEPVADDSANNGQEMPATTLQAYPLYGTIYRQA
jgi:hypothetical protein